MKALANRHYALQPTGIAPGLFGSLSWQIIQTFIISKKKNCKKLTVPSQHLAEN